MRSSLAVLGLLLLVVSAGCAKHAAPAAQTTAANAALDRCDTIVDHLYELILATGKVGFGERMMMKAAMSTMTNVCRSKGGLTAPQAACFLDVKTPEQMDSIEKCPALKEHPLPWATMSFHADDKAAPGTLPPAK